MRRLAAGVTIAVIAVIGIGTTGTEAQETPEPRGQITAADVPSLQLVDYAARGYEDKYGAALQTACTNATAMTNITGGATDIGLGTTIGDKLGSIVIRTQALKISDAKAAKKLVALLPSPECAALVGGDVLSGVVSQYPALPTLTYGALTNTANVITVPFTGTSSIGPLAGTLLVTRADDTIGLAALRVATPQPGQVDSLAAAFLSTFKYETAVASTPAPTPKLLNVEARIIAAMDRAITLQFQSAGIADASAQDVARHGAPSYPPACEKLSEAYTYSGQYAALGGRAIQGSGGKFQMRVESSVFLTPQQAQLYGRYYKNFDTCLNEIWTAPAGTQLTEIVRTPKSGFAGGSNNCQVQYIGTWTAPGASTPALTRAVGVGVNKNAAYFFTAQYDQGNVQQMAIGTCKTAAKASKSTK